MYYCLKELDKIQFFTTAKLSNSIIEKILPNELTSTFLNQTDMRKDIGNAIEREKTNLERRTENTAHIHNRII
jgi:hypothetical protein